MASNSTKKIRNNHLLAEKTFYIFLAKYKVFIFLLFITYPNFKKIGDKKNLPRLMGTSVKILFY